MRKAKTRTYQDLLIAINSSKSTKGFHRLIVAEERAAQALASGGEKSADQAFKDSVTRLVRWIDEPFPASLAETIIRERVRDSEAKRS